MKTTRIRAGVLLAAATCIVPMFAFMMPAAASADTPVSTEVRFTASDGVSLDATLNSQGPIAARPTVVEFSPYGAGTGTFSVGPNYNYLLVQIRGTGDSDGRFDALGPRTQSDVAEVLGWACHQSWSAGSLALAGFSASAIMVYNSLHEPLPCVKALVLKSGTFELYRDLLTPGGISNIVPGAGVLALIGAPTLAQGAQRLQRNPLSALDTFAGLASSGLNAGLLHPTLDTWWQQRGFRGDVNHLPILMIDGFFDVESRGAFQAYRALRSSGAHLLVVGGHDGSPVSTDDGAAQTTAWLDHYLRGISNGVDTRPRVQMLLSDGNREKYLAGDYLSQHAADWPIPGTTWAPLSLDSVSSGTAHSINDGSLGLGTPTASVVQSYPSVPSLPTNTDPANTALIGASGLNTLTSALPILSNMTAAESVGLTYTTKPLTQSVMSAGPASLQIHLSSTAPETAIWAVLSDVAPDGTASPLTVGRLLNSFPSIAEAKSLHDSAGNVIQPYGEYDVKTPAAIGQSRLYQVEFWPVGNRFKAGDRIRLEIVGASAASLPTVPGLNSVQIGGPLGARLFLPVLPGSDLTSALGG